ncbi:hypothetical protein GCM10025298_10700 [Natronobiforma cellulositropha]
MTRALADVSVNVVVAQSTSIARERLAHETVDIVVIDASTVADVAGLLERIDAAHPGTPAFVHWSDDEAELAALAEVVDARGGSDGATPARFGPTETLASAIAASTERRETPLERFVGDVKRRLADATSPGTIEREIREAFTATPGFAFAWLGEYDRGEREIVPWLTDAATVEWPIHRTFAIGDGSQPLLERTLHSRELQTVGRLAENAEAVPLGETALERGVEAVAAAPLATTDELYGVLVVYARDGLTEASREAIRSIAATASYALESVAVRGQLEQQERTLRRYERLVETAGDGMYVLSHEGYVTTVNDALLEMTGYTREGVLGEHISLLFGAESVDAGTETVETLLADGRTTDTIEVTLETKAGQTIPCETQIAVLTHDEEYRGSVGVVRDVTERKQRERTLREQNERLDAFARIVSHDLRNPLGVSQGYLELLEQTESFEYISQIEEGLDRMEAIIADVLAIAREGEGAVEPTPLELGDLVTEAWENVSTGDATLSIEAGESMVVDADRSRVLRLLENLFRNSVEHGGPTVTVRVGTLESPTQTEVDIETNPATPLGSSASEGAIGFYVEDDGRGMPEDIREHVFESSFTTSTSGLGIGLWVVREVATGHGWSAVATESEDGGARFEFVVRESA